MEDAFIILASKNPNSTQYIYQYAKEIPEANIEKLEEAICRTQNAKYIYKFAQCIVKVNISKLEDAIIQTKDYKVIMDFIKNIKKCCLSKFEKVIMESNNTHYIKEYNHLRFLSAKSFSEELNTYTPKQKLDLLNDWIKNDQFLLINCYAEYILLGTENEEIGKYCDKLYELKMKSIGATANIVRLRKRK